MPRPTSRKAKPANEPKGQTGQRAEIDLVTNTDFDTVKEAVLSRRIFTYDAQQKMRNDKMSKAKKMPLIFNA